MALSAHNLPAPDAYDLDRQLETGTAPDSYFGRTQRGLALVETDDVCPQCGGSGETGSIGLSISPSSGVRVRDPQYDVVGECPTCNGRGTI